MSADRRKAATAVGIGLRARQGGAVVVGVAVDGGKPRVVLSAFLATCAEGDRLSLAPYAVAAELRRGPQVKRSADAAAAVAEGRRRQDRAAAKNLRAIVGALEKDGCKPVVAALLVNRAGWVTDLLKYSASWPEHVPVAEGLAVREAIRFAAKACRIKVAELDEKSLPELAANVLDISPAAIDARLKSLGLAVGRPWRKEQKLACLSAWIALAASR